jgi:hypothetical protein
MRLYSVYVRGEEGATPFYTVRASDLLAAVQAVVDAGESVDNIVSTEDSTDDYGELGDVLNGSTEVLGFSS